MNKTKNSFSLFSFLLLLFSAVFVFNGCHFWEESIAPEPEIDYNSYITSVTFDKSEIVINKGEEYNLKLHVSPSEYQNRINVAYEKGNEKDFSGDIDIAYDNYGVIITGTKAGTTYIKAKCNGIVATCRIQINSNGKEESDPYIYSNDTVLEMLPDITQTLQVSLYGGSVEDMEDFTWEVKDSSVAEIMPARNNCIVKSHNPGSTTVTAKHPKAKYEYTFIVYVYTDKLTIPYITTTNNVVTIDKNQESSKRVKVDLVNSYTSSYINDFKWELEDDDSKEIIEISSSQHECDIRPLKNGIARIKVTHPQTDYPLYIVVRVNTIVKNTYIGLSQTTLVINGSDSLYSVTASIEDYDGIVDLEKFTFDVPSSASSLMDWNVHGNVISIQGKKNGKVQIKVGHELAEYKRTLLVILQEQIGSAIDSSMYITTDQNYVQTKVGDEPTRINVHLVGGIDGEDNIGDVNQNFTWYITGNYLNNKNDFVEFHEHTGFLASRSAVDSGKIAPAYLDINPIQEGEFTIHVSHPRCLYETEIKVRVLSEYALTTPPIKINNESSIYRLVNNKSEEEQGSVVISPTLENIDSSALNNLEYESSDNTAISVSPSTGPSTRISAIGSGQHSTYVTIHLDRAIADKKILVLSADTLEEVNSMKAMYSDVSYARLTAETELELTLHTEGFAASDLINWSTEDSSIVIVNPKANTSNNSVAILKGISKGRTNVKASISGCPDVNIEVTVLPVGESPDVITEPKYLTTKLNAVVIENENTSVDLSVTGVNISDSTKYSWTKVEKTADENDPAFVLYSTNSNTATIYANKAGKAIVHVEHPESENTLDINVKCGNLLEWTDGYIPYIVCENGEDVVNIINGQSKTIACALANTDETGIFNFTVTQGSNKIEIVPTTSGLCTIIAKEAGQSIISVTNSITSDITKEILVNVANSEEELKGFKYLTTNDNVVNVGQSQNKNVMVSVVNSDNQILTGYYWEPVDKNIATVSYTGNKAVIYGKNIGTTKINVTNTECDIPLEIIVNVVDPVAAVEDPYISCPNIITCNVGNDFSDVSAELIGGSEAQSNGFTWSSEDPAIAIVQGNNSNAKIKALKEGVTRIVVQHPLASTPRRILVICEPKIENNCYITVSNSIIKMLPSDSPITINAKLENGNADDVYSFKWWADDYRNVTLNPAQNECTITPLSTGTVNIHVSHPKAKYQKDIVLYISQYNDFAFADTQVQLETGSSSQFVQMEVPASDIDYLISFETSDSEVCTAWGNTTVCSLQPGTKEGSCKITAYLKNKGGVVQGTAELLVATVKKDETRPYIGINGQTVLSLNVEETRKLSAMLYGSNLADTTGRGLRWEISKEYQNIISFTNNYLDSKDFTYVTGKECQIKGINNGKAVIKCTHEDDNGRKISPLLIYVIVNGTAEPTITFNWPTMDLVTGEDAQELIATILNSNGEEPEWEIKQTPEDPKQSTCCDVVNTATKAIITPRNPGKVEITAILKSNGSMAKCIITVTEPPRLEFFVYKDETNRKDEKVIDNFNVYPGKQKYLFYRSIPKARDIKPRTAGHYISDANRISCEDLGYGYDGLPDNVGTIKVTGATTESETPIFYKLTTVDNIEKSITLTNNYNYNFTVDKTAITMSVEEAMQTMQKNGVIGPIKYKVSPSCSEIRLYLYNSSFDISTLKHTPTIWYTNSSGAVVQASSTGNLSWVIRNHKYTDPVTETSEGEIWIKSNNEFMGTLNVSAVNKQVIAGGSESEHLINNGYDILLSWYYQEHKFEIIRENDDYKGISSDGKWSKYDYNTNSLTLGDGEIVTFRTKVIEPYASMMYTNAVYVSSSSNIKDPEGVTQSSKVSGSYNTSRQSLISKEETYHCRVVHAKDYKQGGYYYRYNTYVNNLDAYELNNKTVKEYSYVGYLRVSYKILDGTVKDYKIPIYVEVRNCDKNYN